MIKLFFITLLGATLVYAELPQENFRNVRPLDKPMTGLHAKLVRRSAKACVNKSGMGGGYGQMGGNGGGGVGGGAGGGAGGGGEAGGGGGAGAGGQFGIGVQGEIGAGGQGGYGGYGK